MGVSHSSEMKVAKILSIERVISTPPAHVAQNFLAASRFSCEKYPPMPSRKPLFETALQPASVMAAIDKIHTQLAKATNLGVVA